jgi:hypothetical protein
VINRQVKLLEAHATKLRAAGNVSTIKFAGLGFRNMQECHAWSMSNFPGRRYGLMLDRICGADELNSSAGNIWKTMESRINLKITTGAEAAALEALNNFRPRLFYSGRPAMSYERNTSRLSKLLKHGDWKMGGGGVREHIMKQMSILHSSKSHDINHAFGNKAEFVQAHMVSMLSLTATLTLLTLLVGAVDTIYEKLHVQSEFGTAAAWSVTMQILDKFFEELFVPKDGVMQAISLGDPDSIYSHVLYASFKSHDVISVYVDH